MRATGERFFDHRGDDVVAICDITLRGDRRRC
jgi:hypothetical protein